MRIHHNLSLWTLLLMNKILSTTGIACLDCSGSCSNPGVCHTSGKCFLRTDVNGIKYRGCADSWRYRGLDTSYIGCRYQDYLGWNHRKTLWCLCQYHYCNWFPFDNPPEDDVGEPSHRKENLNRNPLSSTGSSYINHGVRGERAGNSRVPTGNLWMSAAESRVRPGAYPRPSTPDRRSPSSSINSNLNQPLSVINDESRRHARTSTQTMISMTTKRGDAEFLDDFQVGSKSQVRDGRVHGQEGYMTQAPTHRVDLGIFHTPRQRSPNHLTTFTPIPFNPSRKWSVYTQSSLPTRKTVTSFKGFFPNFHTTKAGTHSGAENEYVSDVPGPELNVGSVEQDDVNIERDFNSESDVRQDDVEAESDLANDDVTGTGLSDAERTGFVSSVTMATQTITKPRRGLSGEQGIDPGRVEGRAWTDGISENSQTARTESKERVSPRPPDAFSTLSPNKSKHLENGSNRTLPPLAPLTKSTRATTVPPSVNVRQQVTSGAGDGHVGNQGNMNRGSDRYGDGVDTSNHGDGYHRDGDMDKYYKDYQGDDPTARENFTNYRRPEARRAPIDQDGTEADCPSDFERFPQFGSCYKFVHRAINHKEAVTSCRNINWRAHLVTIETREEYLFLRGRASLEKRLLQGWQGWWTAGVYNYNINEFVWSTTGNIISKLDPRWRKPLLLPPYRKTCVWLVPLSGLQFGNFFCNQKTGFICEIEIKQT